jgi:putative flippase GtrA
MSAPRTEKSSASYGRLSGQMMRFALVGVIATCAHYLVAIGAVQSINVYGANLAGYLAAVAISYFGHQRYSFRLSAREISHRSQFPRFILASLGGLVLSYLVLAIMEDGLEAPHWLSLAAAVCLVPVYTFIVNKMVVFRASSSS